jgi:hypothetical protein
MSTIEKLDSKITELEKNILSLNSVFQDNYVNLYSSGSLSGSLSRSLSRSSLMKESIDEEYFKVKEDLSPSSEFIKNIKQNILKPLVIILERIEENSKDIKIFDLNNENLQLRLLQLEKLSGLVKNIPNYDLLVKEFIQKIKVDMVRDLGGDSDNFISVKLNVNLSDTESESDIGLSVSKECKYRDFVKSWVEDKKISGLFDKIGGEKILAENNSGSFRSVEGCAEKASNASKDRSSSTDSEEKSDSPESTQRPSLVAIKLNQIFSPRNEMSSGPGSSVNSTSSITDSDLNAPPCGVYYGCVKVAESFKDCFSNMFNSCMSFKSCCPVSQDNSNSRSGSIELKGS